MAMASTATLLLSSVALPLPSSASSHRATSARSASASSSSGGASNGGVKALAWAVQSQWAGRQLGRARAMQAGGRRRGGVVCEVAVELGGSSRSNSEGEGEKREVVAGTRIRVRHEGPLKVYHVPKNPELDINGMEGEVKEVVTTFKGKPVSATFPYKVQMVLTQGEETRKFFVHLKEDEFEVVE